MRSGKAGRILVHIIVCIAFLSLPVLLAPPEISWEMLRHPHTLNDIFTYALAILFFYLNYFFFIPAFFSRKRYLVYGTISLFFFLVVSFLPRLVLHDHGPPPHLHGRPGEMHGPPPPGLLGDLGHNLFLFLFVFLISLTFSIRERLKQSEKEKLNAELSYLKAQINPHFLFNTLNSIYSLAIQRSDETAAAIVKLSGMMRYITTETQHEFVSLEKELEYIRSYIELQRIRLGDTVDVSFTIEGEPYDKEITPLVLITFVENAFKYGVNPEESSCIRIGIMLINDDLVMEVLNNKVHLDYSDESRSGLGIKNAKGRLKLSYPGKHRLEIHDKEDEYQVLLKLTLK